MTDTPPLCSVDGCRTRARFWVAVRESKLKSGFEERDGDGFCREHAVLVKVDRPGVYGCKWSERPF